MKPPIFPSLSTSSKPQQYLHLARMFRNASLKLPDYEYHELNWPKYTLSLHACELCLKAFCYQVISKEGSSEIARNHDLNGWYKIALKHGLPTDQDVEKGICILTELHINHYTRYPDNRLIHSPDISGLVDKIVDQLISAVTASINQFTDK